MILPIQICFFGERKTNVLTALKEPKIKERPHERLQLRMFLIHKNTSSTMNIIAKMSILTNIMTYRAYMSYPEQHFKAQLSFEKCTNF